ncbi:SPARC-like [Tropilaelaps mercedesae]|uniref:SPARC-like n=1 Tax=Tropilaelaps mercedesae TaxID=418985 RepID=A0A1V9Y336_9ACAR|nr:SPARC-like [Tropilaelaps mercedesae]
MREWLFNIMKDLAHRKALNAEYEKLEKESEQSQGRQWVNAVIWKFCDLDVEPANRVVSRHELYPLKAPLLAMEHCIAPFLDSCDADNDHQVTLKEWGRCLGLEVDEIQDKCHRMHHGKSF